MLTRRTALLALGAPLIGASSVPRTAISLNEDANHFYATRSQRRVTEKDLTDWVDQYAGTQVRELILNVNAQRTSFASKVWTPFWEGYDPQGGEGQPFLAPLPPALRKVTLPWLHTAWQMNADGLDQFRIWTRRAKQQGLSPWLSIRMNDLHYVEDETNPLHSPFWKQHPELRRVPYRGEMRDKALDFGRPEVREYTFKLIAEVNERYEFEGLELDWMRHGFHFAPGREQEGIGHLNEFMRRTRKLVGPRRKIGVRVPPQPLSALRLGMDAVTWAREGWADLVVPTTYWRTVDTNLPIRLWRQLLPAKTLLGAGVELGLNPHIGSQTFEGKPFGANSLTTMRGAAASFFEQGADRLYLFNFMDSQTAIEDLREYQPLLRETGSLATLAGKTRRHVLTYSDTWAPGEVFPYPLPVKLEAGQWRGFRIPTGGVDPALRMRARVGIVGDPKGWTVRVNTVEAKYDRVDQPERPWPEATVHGYVIPTGTMRDGDTVVEVFASSPGTIQWVEIAGLA